MAAHDLEELLAYRSSPEVCRYLPFEPMDEQALTARLGGDLGRSEITAEGQALTLGVELASSGRLVGDGLGLHRLVARMDARNIASARLASRLGMRQEAHFRSSQMFKGAWADLVIYALLDHEWHARRNDRRTREWAAARPTLSGPTAS